MKLYIAGPMKDYENNNFQAFEEATRKLRGLGFEVVSPHEIGQDTQPSDYGDDYDKICRDDIKEMMICDEIATLPGWEKSRGARTETAVGILVGIPNYPILHYYGNGD